MSPHLLLILRKKKHTQKSQQIKYEENVLKISFHRNGLKDVRKFHLSKKNVTNPTFLASPPNKFHASGNIHAHTPKNSTIFGHVSRFFTLTLTEKEFIERVGGAWNVEKRTSELLTPNAHDLWFLYILEWIFSFVFSGIYFLSFVMLLLDLLLLFQFKKQFSFVFFSVLKS